MSLSGHFVEFLHLYKMVDTLMPVEIFRKEPIILDPVTSPPQCNIFFPWPSAIPIIMQKIRRPAAVRARVQPKFWVFEWEFPANGTGEHRRKIIAGQNKSCHNENSREVFSIDKKVGSLEPEWLHENQHTNNSTDGNAAEWTPMGMPWEPQKRR